jgi:hypothetical protein
MKQDEKARAVLFRPDEMVPPLSEHQRLTDGLLVTAPVQA